MAVSTDSAPPDSQGWYVGIDIGGTNVRAATVDAGGRIHDRRKAATSAAVPRISRLRRLRRIVLVCILHPLRRMILHGKVVSRRERFARWFCL